MPIFGAWREFLLFLSLWPLTLTPPAANLNASRQSGVTVRGVAKHVRR
jgi:hypothetical protein